MSGLVAVLWAVASVAWWVVIFADTPLTRPVERVWLRLRDGVDSLISMVKR